MNAPIRLFKIIWLYFWVVTATSVMFLPITISALLSSTGNLAFSLSKVWAWMMLIVTRTRVKIKNKEKIEKGRSYIIISNHQSLFDIPVLVTRLGIQFRWVIKNELRKIPLFGYALFASRNVFIDRSNSKKAIESIHKGLSRLPSGAGVMFFAEGSRSSDGRIKEFKKGGFIMAIEKEFPILPVTINGTRKILPKGTNVFQSGKVEMVIGDPINVQGYSTDTIGELIDKTRNVVMSNYHPSLDT